MAVTTNQLQTVIASVPFRQRVEFALVAIAINVCSESTGTALHNLRKQLAVAVMNNPDNYVTQFAQGVVTQLSLATTNMVTVNAVPNADVDTTDAALQTAISSIWNDFFIS